MSCNGCRVLRRGCSDQCKLRPCLDWIETPQAQANATLFVSKFFGRSDLMSFISAVPETKRAALFRSLLFEACGRTVDPVNGAVGLLSTGNWHICEEAVEAVLAGAAPRSLMQSYFIVESHPSNGGGLNCMKNTASFGSGISEVSPSPPPPPPPRPEFGEGASGSGSGSGGKQVGSKRPKLLNLFA